MAGQLGPRERISRPKRSRSPRSGRRRAPRRNGKPRDCKYSTTTTSVRQAHTQMRGSRTAAAAPAPSPNDLGQVTRGDGHRRTAPRARTRRDGCKWWRQRLRQVAAGGHTQLDGEALEQHAIRFDNRMTDSRLYRTPSPAASPWPSCRDPCSQRAPGKARDPRIRPAPSAERTRPASGTAQCPVHLRQGRNARLVAPGRELPAHRRRRAPIR